MRSLVCIGLAALVLSSGAPSAGATRRPGGPRRTAKRATSAPSARPRAGKSGLAGSRRSAKPRFDATATYGQHLREGAAPEDAANLTAAEAGLPIAGIQWTLKRVKQVLFVRYLRASGKADEAASFVAELVRKGATRSELGEPEPPEAPALAWPDDLPSAEARDVESRARAILDRPEASVADGARGQASAAGKRDPRAIYRRLRQKGMSTNEAANLTAFELGLPTAEGQWTLEHVQQALFLRHLRSSGRRAQADEHLAHLVARGATLAELGEPPDALDAHGKKSARAIERERGEISRRAAAILRSSAQNTAQVTVGKIQEEYRRARQSGLGEREAINLVAWMAGLPLKETNWSLKDVTRLLDLREQHRAGRYRDEGKRTPLALQKSRGKRRSAKAASRTVGGISTAGELEAWVAAEAGRREVQVGVIRQELRSAVYGLIGLEPDYWGENSVERLPEGQRLALFEAAPLVQGTTSQAEVASSLAQAEIESAVMREAQRREVDPQEVRDELNYEAAASRLGRVITYSDRADLAKLDPDEVAALHHAVKRLFPERDVQP